MEIREGQWVWSLGGGYVGKAAKPQWVRIISNEGNLLWLCRWDHGQDLNMFEWELDQSAGAHDEKPTWTPQDERGE